MSIQPLITFKAGKCELEVCYWIIYPDLLDLLIYRSLATHQKSKPFPRLVTSTFILMMVL